MTVVRRGRGRPGTVFAPGHGRAVDVTEEWVRCLRLPGTRLFFEYERSGNFDSTRGIRRKADRDAFEVCAVADEGRATRAVGFSRGARAVVGALVRDPGRFERVVLVWPPGGWAAGDYASWVGHEKVKPERVVRPGADVLVVAQHIDRDHSMKMAEQWAWALGAKLEVFPPKGLLWDVHRERFRTVVSGFLNR
jgi:hypothetical protein